MRFVGVVYFCLTFDRGGTVAPFDLLERAVMGRGVNFRSVHFDSFALRAASKAL